MRIRDRITAHRYALLLVSSGLLLLFSSGVRAQTVKVTANPSSITDATKPSAVVLHVTKADDSAVDKTLKSAPSTWLR